MTNPSLKQALILSGLPASDACLIQDLADHAAMEAVHAITRIADTAPNGRAKTLVVFSASKILIDNLSLFIEDATKQANL